MRLEQEIIMQGKANDQIISEMTDIKQDILNLSRIGTFLSSKKVYKSLSSARESSRTQRKQQFT